MSVRRLHHTQPAGFKFSAENKAVAKKEMKKYPAGRQASAVISLLWVAQKQNDGWVSEPVIRHVAELLSMPYIRVFEVATFYTMFNLSPVGKFFVQFCGTTPCWLRGADALKAVCNKVIGPEKTISEDGQLSWLEVECLGACCNAPMVQINDDYYEDLDAATLEQLLDDLRHGRPTKVGPQVDRQTSAPRGGATTLLDPELYAGKVKRAPRKTAAKPKAATKTATKPKTNFVVKATGKKKTTAVKSPAVKKPKAPRKISAARANDLKRIGGVGPKIEGILNGLGIYRFDQIAKWTRENIEWVDEQLNFKGRIDRENWIDQAMKLASDEKGKGGK